MFVENRTRFAITETNIMKILIRCRLTRHRKPIHEYHNIHLGNTISPFSPISFRSLISNQFTTVIQDTLFEICM